MKTIESVVRHRALATRPVFFACGFLVAFLLIFAGAGPLWAVTNTLRILSIVPDTNGYLTLTWASRPGEYYIVYAADSLADWTV